MSDYLKAKAVALVKSFAVKFLNVDLFRLVHVCEVAGIQTFVDVRDGVVDMVAEVHNFFLQIQHSSLAKITGFRNEG